MKIILAAEEMFADGSFDGASLREIAIRAGQGNNFAVQYHFGSRDGLVLAIFDHRMGQMEAARGKMLARAEAQGLLRDARTLLDIIYLPQLELQDADGNRSYANFLGQYLLRSQSSKFGDFGENVPPNLARTFTLLRERLIYLPDAVAQRRLIACSLMFLNILVQKRTSDERGTEVENFDDALEDTMEQIVTTICSPIKRRD